MPDTAPSPGKWGDLGTRIASAVVMLAVTIGALWAGGLVWAALVVIVAVLMGWELAPLCEPGVDRVRRLSLAIVFAAPLVLVASLHIPGPIWDAAPIHEQLAWGAMLLPPLLGAFLLREARLIWVGYSLLILLGSRFFLSSGLETDEWSGIIFVAVIVILSDTLGYFVGRLVGGPKFWPRVSPKKTWSGTIAGWIGGVLWVSFVFSGNVESFPGDPLTPGEYFRSVFSIMPYVIIQFGLIGAVLVFAGQMGDIAESAMKRRVGVKDSSNLIPGHGGLLDRLDAMIAVAAAVSVWFELPNFGVFW